MKLIVVLPPGYTLERSEEAGLSYLFFARDPFGRRVVFKADIRGDEYSILEYRFLYGSLGYQPIIQVVPVEKRGLIWNRWPWRSYNTQIKYRKPEEEEKEPYQTFILEHLDARLDEIVTSVGTQGEKLQISSIHTLPLPHIFALKCLYYLACAVAYIHAKRCIHNDIKSTNIGFRPTKDEVFHEWKINQAIQSVLYDFNVATVAKRNLSKASESILTFIAYRLGHWTNSTTPWVVRLVNILQLERIYQLLEEMLYGSKPLGETDEWRDPDMRNKPGDYASDVFSLGLIFCFFWIGRSPEKNGSHAAFQRYKNKAIASMRMYRLQKTGVEEWGESLQAKMENLASWMLTPNRNDRPSAQDVAAEAARLLRTSGAEKVYSSRKEQLNMWMTEHYQSFNWRLVAIVFILIVILFLSGLSGLTSVAQSATLTPVSITPTESPTLRPTNTATPKAGTGTSTPQPAIDTPTYTSTPTSQVPTSTPTPTDTSTVTPEGVTQPDGKQENATTQPAITLIPTIITPVTITPTVTPTLKRVTSIPTPGSVTLVSPEAWFTTSEAHAKFSWKSKEPLQANQFYELLFWQKNVPPCTPTGRTLKTEVDVQFSMVNRCFDWSKEVYWGVRIVSDKGRELRKVVEVRKFMWHFK